jgi:hypothetical protein
MDNSKDDKGKETMSNGAKHSGYHSKDNREGKESTRRSSSYISDKSKYKTEAKSSDSQHGAAYSKDAKEGKKTKDSGGVHGSDYSESNNTKDKKEEHKANYLTSIVAESLSGKPSSIFLVNVAPERKEKTRGKERDLHSLMLKRKARRNGVASDKSRQSYIDRSSLGSYVPEKY